MTKKIKIPNLAELSEYVSAKQYHEFKSLPIPAVKAGRHGSFSAKVGDKVVIVSDRSTLRKGTVGIVTDTFKDNGYNKYIICNMCIREGEFEPLT